MNASFSPFLWFFTWINVHGFRVLCMRKEGKGISCLFISVWRVSLRESLDICLKVKH